MSIESIPHAKLTDLVHNRLPDDETCLLLRQLTPDKVTFEVFDVLVRLIKNTAVPVPPLETLVLDCCGTGGSGASVFNTSTAVAFVLAAGGIPVVKFGNRSITSASGSFDFLSCLGLTSELSLQALPALLAETNLVFLYAPQCYPQFKRLSQLRKQIGVKTVFNFLGPLLNPVSPQYRLLGVSDSRMQKLIARYLAEKDERNQCSWVLHSAFEETAESVTDSCLGLDELDLHRKTTIVEVRHSEILSTSFLPELLSDMMRNNAVPSQPLLPQESADRLLAIVSGDDCYSYYYHLLCLNAGAGFCLAARTDTVSEGITFAQTLIKRGTVMAKIQQLRRSYERLAEAG